MAGHVYHVVFKTYRNTGDTTLTRPAAITTTDDVKGVKDAIREEQGLASNSPIVLLNWILMEAKG